MQHRFTRTTLFIVGGLLIWLTNFVFVYTFAAVACARGFADLRVLAMPIVPLATAIASLVAGVATVALLVRGRKHYAMAVDDHSRFIGFVTVATSIVALVALMLLLLPQYLLVRSCQ
jgi:hypothetical protein